MERWRWGMGGKKLWVLRVKVDVSEELKRRAEACAGADGVEEWALRACVEMKTGMWNELAWERETQDLARSGKEVMVVNAPKGLNSAQIRLAMACACEEKRLERLERLGG